MPIRVCPEERTVVLNSPLAAKSYLLDKMTSRLGNLQSRGEKVWTSQPQNWFENSLLPAILKVVLWGYVILSVVSSFAVWVDEFDAPIPLVHGMLIQQGRTPNLDFYSFYPPLGLYVNAALFSLLSRTVLAPRVFAAILFLLLLPLVTKFFRSRFPHSHSLVPAAVLLVAASIGNALRLPSWSGFAVAMAALLTYLISQRGLRNSLWMVGVSGVLTGFAVLYRINFGAYVVMVVAFDLVVPWLWRRGEAGWDLLRLKSDSLTAAAFLGPLAVFCAGFCFWVYGRHTFAAVTNLVVTAQRVMILRGFIELPFSLWIGCAVALPAGWFFLRILVGSDTIPVKAFVPAAFAIALVSVVVVGRMHFAIVLIVTALAIAAVVLLQVFIYHLERSEFCLLLFFCGLVHYYLSRAEWFHWRVLPIGAAMLLPFLVFSGAEAERDSSVSKGTAMAVLLAACFLCLVSDDIRPAANYVPKGLPLLADLVRHPHLSDSDRMLGPVAPRAAWSAPYADENELRALRYLRGKTTSADAIFVGVPDHSRIYLNNLRIYWLAGRPIGVRTFQLEARIATEPEVQKGIIEDLKQNNVKWVIIDTNPWVPDPTFVRHPYAGSKMLDEYIAQHYREEARFGLYKILRLESPR